MTMADTLASNEGPWTSAKALAAVIEGAILQKRPGMKYDLELALRKNKHLFVSLLKNPSRNANDAELVRKAQTEGIRLPNQTAVASEEMEPQKLPSQVVEEALIIAEMYNLNEITALQFLLKGEEQLCQYPGLTRGLVAILLYYDEKKSLVQSLRTLIQGREGVSWTLDLPEDISELITHFTKELLREGLLDKVLNLLGELDWTQESVMLQKNLALGDAKHRRQVHDLFQDIRQGLADCVFCYAAQSGLPKNETLKLMDFLAKIKQGDSNQIGVIENTTLTLAMAFLYAVDVSAIQKSEDGENTLESMPIFEDPSFAPAIHKELGPQPFKQWNHPGLQGLAYFAWAMSIASLRSVTQNENLVDDDETIMDFALDNRVFHHLPNFILNNEMFRTEEFYVRRMHQLVTDFIVLMPLKVKELRNRADDSARNSLMHEQEGIHYNIPLQGQHFEHLLNAIDHLYRHDDLNLCLVTEYWCPPEGGTIQSSIGERYPQRQLCLYKFLRLAGDLLMPTLYASYVNLLATLSSTSQTAMHCYNLLKMNGGQQGSSAISWDHFFVSLQQYFSNLRQEFPPYQMPMTDTIYRLGRPLTRGISPSEVKGLLAVLRLIRTVCDNSEAARVAIATENNNWQALFTIIGLLGCPVPTVLKAELLRTLAALAKSNNIGEVIWNNVESAQLVATVPGHTVAQHGLNAELENVETRAEEYSMTIAFLDLMDRLTDAPIPPNLGAGVRPLGFDPYLSFLLDAILLKFHTRSYKDESQKWKIAEGCLKILNKLLRAYTPQLDDFSRNTVHQPGFLLMVQLLQSSEFLRVLLFILDQGVRLLELYQPFNGKRELESTCECTLKMLEAALNREQAFLDCAKEANSALFLSPLEQLLLGVNPRSGKPDHMLNITKFVTFSWWLPTQALYAIKVLTAVSSSVGAQSGLLATLNSSESLGKAIIMGFTQVLDNDEEEQGEEGDMFAMTNSISEARIAVVQLLLNGLDKPAPSLSHFLLGFDCRRGINRGTLQPPGVLGAVRTPLHSVLSLLRPIGPRTPSSIITKAPLLCEASYKLIYFLAANPVTSEPVLRYLRSNEDFISTQLTLLPLPEDLMNVQIVKSMSWLMKTVAIELKLVCDARLRSQVSLLLSLLLATDEEPERAQDESVAEFTSSQLSRSVNVTRPMTSSQNRQHRILQILNAIDFTQLVIERPQWEAFDAGQVEQVLKRCEVSDPINGKAIDVTSLHRVLSDELSTLQGTVTLNQRQAIHEDIKSILIYAIKWNALRGEGLTRRDILDAWRQIVEVLLCTVPNDILPVDARQQLLLDILQTLLNKVLAEEAMPELANQVSGVVLLLLNSLRQTYEHTTEEKVNDEERDNYVGILDYGEPLSIKKPKVFSSALHVILRGLLHWISETDNHSQRVRSNLYGALLNYLRIGKNDQKLKRSANLALSEVAKFRKLNLEILIDFGETFLDVLSNDSVSGHHIRRMLALSVLDELIALNERGNWTYYLSKQGYLKHLIESFTSEDEGLIQLITQEPQNLKMIYTYESRMAMLNRLASTPTGAEILLESGLMVRLSEMSVFSARPDVSPSYANNDMDVDPDDLVPSPLARYYQILFPVLRICQALLASLGAQNVSAVTQVRHFLLSNDELMRSAFRARGIWTLVHLRELALLTNLTAICANTNEELGEKRTDGLVSANASKLQRLMLSIIPHYDLNEDLLKQIRKNMPEKHRVEALRCILEVNANAMMFAKNLVVKAKSLDDPSCRVIFQPSLGEALDKVDFQDNGQGQMVLPTRPPTLGQLVPPLNHLCKHLILSHGILEDLKEKLSNLDGLSSVELSSVIEGTNQNFNIVGNLSKEELDKKGVIEKRAMAAKQIRASLEAKSVEVKLAGTAIECASLVIMKHLEHFLLVAGPESSMTPFQRLHKTNLDLSESSESFLNPMGSLDFDTLQKLKEDSKVCFSESFYSTIEEVDRICKDRRASSDRPGGAQSMFMSVIIRRLKRLTSLYT